MTYDPITPENKQDWIDFLKKIVSIIDKKTETNDNTIFESNDVGDVAMAKDVVGAFLAALTNEQVTIN